MNFKKLTSEQREIKRWREKRNHLVCELLNADRFLSRKDALRMANQLIRGKDRKDSQPCLSIRRPVRPL